MNDVPLPLPFSTVLIIIIIVILIEYMKLKLLRKHTLISKVGSMVPFFVMCGVQREPNGDV